MSKTKKLIIVGAGETAELAYEYFTVDSEYEVVGFAVERTYIKSESLHGLPVVALENIELRYPPKDYSVFVAVSSTKLNRIRTRFYADMKQRGYRIASYVSSRAFVWRNVEIGENCFIFEDNTVQPFVKLGNNVVLWSGNHIGHNTVIRDNCFVSSHVVISGFCDIGENCFLGVNSTIINNISIGKDCFIGAGALIQKDTPEGSVLQEESTEIFQGREPATVPDQGVARVTLEVRPFLASDANEWNLFCESAMQSTFLHSRRFLSYHGERFVDQSLIVSEDSLWMGVLPAALHHSDNSIVVSHPGITYGGVLHQGGLRGERMIEALQLVCRHYANQGFRKLTYKAIPTFYDRFPAQDDLYALFRLGATRVRCDLSSTIDLQFRLPLTKGRKWGLKKAQKSGVSVAEGIRYLPEVWNILAENLSRKHNAAPVHSLEELLLLADRFPSNIRCICGHQDGAVVAGVVLFVMPTVLHTQYIAANDTGHDICALDSVIDFCIQAGISEGKRWFDFGISNEQAGMVLNDGLYRFKNSFGGGGYVHEFYELDLLGGLHAA